MRNILPLRSRRFSSEELMAASSIFLPKPPGESSSVDDKVIAVLLEAARAARLSSSSLDAIRTRNFHAIPRAEQGRLLSVLNKHLSTVLSIPREGLEVVGGLSLRIQQVRGSSHNEVLPPSVNRSFNLPMSVAAGFLVVLVITGSGLAYQTVAVRHLKATMQSEINRNTALAAEVYQRRSVEKSLRASIENTARISAQLQEQVRQLSNALPRRPADRNANAIDPSLVEATPLLSFERVTLGPTQTQSQVLTVSTPLPSVRLPMVLGSVRQNAKIDARITGVDPPIERQDLTVEGSGPEKHASLVLKPDEVRRLVNRQVQLTLTDRGYAPLGTVNITVTLR
jgi:hypothetical protein